MRTEVPLCRRCCFCVPLRYGLLVWGYLALLPSVMLLISESYLFYDIKRIVEYFTVFELIHVVVSFLAKVIDFTLILLLIIASHKKNTHLLKIYFTYGLWSIGLNVLLIVASTVIELAFGWNYSYWPWQYLFFQIVANLVFVGLQLYIIAMVRSEIFKLENSSKFEFRNIAAEAECAYYGPNEGTTNVDNHHDAQVTVYNEVTKNNNEVNEQSSDIKEDNASKVGKTNNKTNVMLNSGLSAIVNKNVGYGKVVNEE